jgi:2-C-methyl-D-erythritol 4-phosphate cytidylyltransferase
VIIKAILLMGGKGTRFSSTTLKQHEKINGKKLYQITIDMFSTISEINELILVSNTNELNSIAGGTTRQNSSYQGLLACGTNTDIVIIHDCIRPFVSSEIIKENIQAAKQYHAVDTCIPSPDTIIHTTNQKQITAIPQRKQYWLGQTPQTFSYPLIREAHERTKKTDAYDDCSLVLDLPHPVHIIRGSPLNIKITYPADLLIAHAIHNSLKNASV